MRLDTSIVSENLGGQELQVDPKKMRLFPLKLICKVIVLKVLQTSPRQTVLGTHSWPLSVSNDVIVFYFEGNEENIALFIK